MVPTPNNGSTELISLHHKGQQEPWFIFQKTKYHWDPHDKSFKGLQFPIDHSVKHYCEWKGYLDDKEIAAAEQKYDLNKYVRVRTVYALSRAYTSMPLLKKKTIDLSSR